MERLAFVDQMSDRSTNRRLIEISCPTCCLVDQVAGQKMSSRPPVLGSIRPIRVNYIEATSVHHAGTNLRSTAQVEPPPPPTSRHRRRLRRAAATARITPPPDRLCHATWVTRPLARIMPSPDRLRHVSWPPPAGVAAFCGPCRPGFGIHMCASSSGARGGPGP